MSTILDTRNLDKRLNELRSLKNDLETAIAELDAHNATERPDDDGEQDEYDETTDELETAVADARDCFGPDEEAELAELEAMESEIREWCHGETLIPESEFTDYVMEMLSDYGELPREIPWYIVIDREATARNVRLDYGEIEYQGTTYLYRV